MSHRNIVQFKTVVRRAGRSFAACTLQFALLLGACLPTAVFAQSGEQPEPAESDIRLAVDLLRSPLLAAALTGAPQTNLQENSWELQYEAAQRKKSAGKKWMLAGAGVTAAGFVLVVHQMKPFEDCVDRVFNEGAGGVCTYDARAGAAVALGGAGMLGWGIHTYLSGRRAIQRLELLRDPITGNPAIAVPVRDGHAITASIGRDSALGYSITW